MLFRLVNLVVIADVGDDVGFVIPRSELVFILFPVFETPWLVVLKFFLLLQTTLQRPGAYGLCKCILCFPIDTLGGFVCTCFACVWFT